jgi:hypothetical protein
MRVIIDRDPTTGKVRLTAIAGRNKSFADFLQGMRFASFGLAQAACYRFNVDVENEEQVSELVRKESTQRAFAF